MQKELLFNISCKIAYVSIVCFVILICIIILLYAPLYRALYAVCARSSLCHSTVKIDIPVE